MAAFLNYNSIAKSLYRLQAGNLVDHYFKKSFELQDLLRVLQPTWA